MGTEETRSGDGFDWEALRAEAVSISAHAYVPYSHFPVGAAAVAEAHDAGLRVIMITGDHPKTAERVARDLGISPPNGNQQDVRSLSGLELDDLDDKAFAETVRAVILSR